MDVAVMIFGDVLAAIRIYPLILTSRQDVTIPMVCHHEVAMKVRMARVSIYRMRLSELEDMRDRCNEMRSSMMQKGRHVIHH
jgi:hypothetical protein